ncbi:MAG: hypothetical protein H7175_14670, partial [Burkholderiales bacterium]|nr:hypothetical protein [Anaerolineae bacterium]
FSGRGTAWDYIYKFTVQRIEMMSGVISGGAPAAPSAPTPPSATTPVSTPATVALPTTGWRSAMVSSPYEFSRVREQPSTRAAEVGRILKAESPLEIAPDARTADLDGTPNKWIAVRTPTWRGWIREDVVSFRLENAPTPPDSPAAAPTTTSTSATATTTTAAPVDAREAAPAPEPAPPPVPERKPHTVQFTFFATDEEVEHLRAAIERSPEAFSEFVETYGSV